MADVREIGFELERFGWTDGDLEVVGRWSGLEGRRLGRPVLTLVAGGRRRRLTALPGGHLAPADDARWRARFSYDGDPEEVTGAELEIGRRLVVDLPPPRRRRRRPPDDSDPLRHELAELRAQVAELRLSRATPPAPTPEPAESPDTGDPLVPHDLVGELEILRRDLAARDDELIALRAGLSAGADEVASLSTDLEAREAQIASLRQQIEDQRGRSQAAEQELTREVERLRGELEALRETHGKLDADHGDAAQARDFLTAELTATRTALTAAESERDRLAAELTSAREALATRESELGEAREAIAATREQTEQRLAAERAASTEVREKLATAREETNSTIEAEARETERLRAELLTAREEAEQALSAERDETSRLRAELASRAATDTNGTDGDEAESAAKRMYERIAHELERERSTNRSLRRELDAVQAQTAEHRRVVSAAAANGVAAADEAPLAATPAGRLAASRRTDAGRAAAQHRAEAARVAAAQRVPEHHASAIAVWGVRLAAVALVAGLLVAALIIISAVA